MKKIEGLSQQTKEGGLNSSRMESRTHVTPMRNRKSGYESVRTSTQRKRESFILEDSQW